MSTPAETETFLIVEDEPVTLELISAFLDTGRVCSYRVARSVEEAVAELNGPGDQVTAVICDHDLGGATGIDLLGGIRTGQVAHVDRHLPFIMLTGHGDEHIIKTALALDVHAYLMKPVSQKQILHSLDKALTRELSIKPAQHYQDVMAGL